MYVVWVKRWGTDTRGEIDGAGMVDPRVVHLWDTAGVIGQPFLERFGVDLGGLDYDFFVLFGPEAAWGEPPRVCWRLRCFGFRIDYSVLLSH